MKMSKQIGVLVSSGYGSGWSTWNSPECALDQELVAAIEAKLPYEEIEEIAKRNWPYNYLGGLGDCYVEWVAEGTTFRIEEYDGAESICFLDSYSWQVAK
jgi:hypothetical protein